MRRSFSAVSLATLGGFLVSAAACGPAPAPAVPPAEIVVTAQDYAFQLPDNLQPGPAVLRFRNAGAVPHEMALALFKPGVTMQRMMEVMGAGGSPDSLIEGVAGILIADPGKTTIGALNLDLLPGRIYVFGCNFKDAPDKPEHMMLGMVTTREIASAQE